jgi:DNA-binding MarR family transcriptional regulator
MPTEIPPIDLSDVTESEYDALSRLRRGLGDLYAFVQDAAGSHGCSVGMYQLLLALKTARRQDAGMDIGMIATALQVRHPSAAEMVRKAQAQGFVTASDDPNDARRVLVVLSDKGAETLALVARAHAAEVRRARAGFLSTLHALG